MKNFQIHLQDKQLRLKLQHEKLQIQLQVEQLPLKLQHKKWKLSFGA